MTAITVLGTTVLHGTFTDQDFDTIASLGEIAAAAA